MPQKNAAAMRCEGAPLTARPQLDRAHAQAQGWPTRSRSLIDEPPCMLIRPCVLPALYRSGDPPTALWQARSTSSTRGTGPILAPQQAAVCVTRRSRQHPMSELSSIGNLGTVRSTACLNSTRPAPMDGRFLYLSVLRFSAPPRDPSTHNETPCSSADALCWLPARRLLRDHRHERCLNDSRAPHGAAGAERGVVVRGRAMYCGCARHAVPQPGRE